jgi:DNA-binding IclR family transcriptional regulator
MERELERVRRNGFATDVEEYLDGIRAVAAPVHNADGSVAGALCALGVAVRLKRDALPAIIEATRTAARGLSRDLGADPRGREVA